VFFIILRSKIMKNTSVSKEYSAAEGGKGLFTQPQYNLARSAMKSYALLLSVGTSTGTFFSREPL
ncbi:MAG: hypothetical protein RL386_1348, partial [Bacteroidota bacterium]